MSDKKKQLIIFTTSDGKISIDTRFDEETAWLSLDQMAELFERDKSTISRHIKNLFEEDELEHRVGGEITPAVLPHHRTYGSVYGGSR